MFYFFKYVLDISIFLNIFLNILKSPKNVFWPILWYPYSLNNGLFWHYFSSNWILFPWQPGSYYTKHHHDCMQNNNCASEEFHKYIACTEYIWYCHLINAILLWFIFQNRPTTGCHWKGVCISLLHSYG